MRYRSFNFSVAVLSVVSALALAACTPKNVERKPHRSKPKINFVDTAENPQLQAQFDQLIVSEYAKRSNYDDFLATAPTDEALIFSQILDPLAPVILTEQYFRTPKWVGSNELIELLGLFNRGFAIVIEQSTPDNRSDKLKKTIETYLSILFSSCRVTSYGVDISRGCYNLPVFVSDFATNRVLLSLAEERSEELTIARQAYRAASMTDSDCSEDTCSQAREAYLTASNSVFSILKVVKQSRNRNIESDLLLLWQRHAEDNHFYYSQTNEPMDALQRQMNCRAFSSSLENMEVTADPSDEVSQQYFEILDRFRPYDPVSENAFCISNIEQIRADWFQHRLFDEGQFDPTGQLQMYLNESQAIRTELIDQPNVSGLRQSEKIELLRRNRYFTNSMSVTPLERNLLFYIIDEVYHERLSIENATLIWNQHLAYTTAPAGAEESSARGRHAALLYREMNVYLRNEIAFLALKSNEHFRDFFDNRTFNSKDILKTFVSHSRILSTSWRDLKDGADRLLLFIEDAMERELTSRSGIEYENFQTQKTNLKSIDKSINLVSVLPHMLMLSYFLGKFDGKAEVYIWWLRETKQIPLDGLIKRLISGDEKNIWLDYGDPNQNITHYLMLHVFDFWARTDVIASYATVEEETDGEETALVSENAFFDFLIDKYIKEELDQIETGISMLNRVTDSKVDDFLSRCARPDQRQTIQADAFVTQTLIDTSASFFTDMYTPLRTGMIERVKEVREKFQPKLQAIESFRNTVQFHRDNPPVNLTQLEQEAAALEEGPDKDKLQAVIDREVTRRTNVDVALDNLDRRILELQSSRNEFLGKALDYFDSFYTELPDQGPVNCLHVFALEENRRRINLARIEQEYLKDVHAAVLTLNGAHISNATDLETVTGYITRLTAIPDTEKEDILSRVRRLYEILDPSRLGSQAELKAQVNEILGVNTSDRSLVMAFDLTHINESGQTEAFNWSSHGEIHRDGFVHHSVDFLLRMRHFLNRGYQSLGPQRSMIPVARFLDIEIPADFPKWTYNDEETNPLPRRFSQARFLQTHMATMDGGDSAYVTWFAPDNFSTPNSNVQNGVHPFNYIYTQLRYAREFMLWSEIPTGENYDCNVDNCETFSPSKLISLFEDFTDAFQLDSPEERKIYQIIQQPGRGTPRMTRNLYLLSSLESNSSLFSKQFELFYDYSTNEYLKTLEEFYKQENLMLRPLDTLEHRYDLSVIPVNEQVVEQIRDQFMPAAYKFFSQVMKFKLAVEQRESETADEPIVVTLENNLGVNIATNGAVQNDAGFKVLMPLISESSGNPIYLDEATWEKFGDTFKDFHENTKCTLIPKAGDREVELYDLNLRSLEAVSNCSGRAQRLYEQMLRGLRAQTE
ncbi:MAG: hypothetical protein HRT45_07000 [Bdellovibrionales bacterium]|nr:hypothetical protein [Bdellovibrionales bacterium]